MLIRLNINSGRVKPIGIRPVIRQYKTKGIIIMPIDTPNRDKKEENRRGISEWRVTALNNSL